MKLKSIKIENFRSIEGILFNIEEIDKSFTFSLIGVNEAGKSSFLNAISLVDRGDISYPLDFWDEKKPVNIYLNYDPNSVNLANLKKTLLEKGFPQKITESISLESLSVSVHFEPVANTIRKTIDVVKFKKTKFSDYTLHESKPIMKDPNLPQEDFDLQNYIAENMPGYFWKFSHKITFWKSEDKYLINKPIDLEAFMNDPENISIPLLNCFRLAGISDIKLEINKIKTSAAEINNLQDKLNDNVTSHIKNIWPNHPVKIKFQINNMQLNFLVEDEGVKYKAKTTSQRSDGFRQFVSFLLSVSAENITQKLLNSFLLLDEPETHLHPQAQEYLKEELINLSKNSNNNIVIFATHSNYMIDKNHLERCFRTIKSDNGATQHRKIKSDNSSYSEVNYEVFDIATTDYHNELYGYLEDWNPNKLNGLSKNKKWYNEKLKKEEIVSLPKYIRHSIHHPENSKNNKFTAEDLQKSIQILRKLKYNP